MRQLKPQENKQQYWPFVIYFLINIFLRFWNFQHTLYFIYDQGRDAWVLDRIAQGHPVLVGPTSGLSGFFLGPLWYYMGLPGYFLSRGNPYGICLWYMAISCAAIPLFWYLSHRLFQKKFWAMLCAYFLSIIPGALSASLMIWNPLLSVPLILGSLLSLWKSRQENSRKWLALGFFCLALTLQSEFAYAIFLIVPLFLLIPWIRQKFDWRDYAAVIVASGLTFLPQLLFELRNKFIMTTSLLKGFQDTSRTVSWALQLHQRPTQLWETTKQVLVGGSNVAPYLFPLMALFALIGVYFAIREKNQQTGFLWRLIALFGLLPYPFYMVWRGNNGNFFWYYLTCQFVFVIPLMCYGFFKLIEAVKSKQKLTTFVLSLVVFISLNLVAVSWLNWYQNNWKSDAQANLHSMLTAVARVYEVQAQAKREPFVVTTFTANTYTEQYDYLFHWYAKAHNLQEPTTVRQPADQYWYLFIETGEHTEVKILDDWYKKATEGGKQITSEKIGIFQLEEWTK